MEAGNDPGDDVPTQVEPDSGMPRARVATASSTTPRDMLPDWLKDQVMHSFGAKLGRYALLKVLGEGGMGVVFAAYDDELDRKVAIKLLRKPAQGVAWDRSWLRNEAKAMARLSHPNIVQVYDVAEADEQLFVAMEFVPGVSLQAWFRAQRRGWREVVDVCQQAGRGLLAAHEAGLVHRDFKPANVIVGSDGRVRVLDFGLSVLREQPQAAGPGRAEDWQRSTLIGGTPGYMAPEQYLLGEANAYSDQFAFCVALYQGLFGKRPFAGSTYHELRLAICTGLVEPPPADARVPTWLRRAVMRGLSRDPRQRWPSMAALLAELARDPARRAVRAGLVVGVLALVGVTAVSVVDRRTLAAELEARRCDGVGALEAAWGPEEREAVHKAMSGSGLVFAADTARRVEEGLDAYGAAWSAMRVEACEAHRAGAQSDRLYDLRVACLEQRRTEMAALVAVFAAADQGVVTKAVKATSDLRPVSGCADASALLAPVAPPATAEAAEMVAGLRRPLAAARAELQAGRALRAREQLVALAPAVDAVDYKPLRAEVLLARGLAEDSLGDYKASAASLEEAMLVAEASHHEQIAAEAAIRLVFVTGYRQSQVELAAPWQRLTEALLERRGGARELAIRWLSVKAGVAMRAGDYPQALAFYESVPLTPEPPVGANPYEIATLYGNMGSMAGILGDPEKSRANLERGLALLVDVLGPEHPDVAVLTSNLGSAAVSRGDLVGARAYLLRALAINELNFGDEHPDRALIFSNLGATAALMGDIPGSLAWHEKALAMRIKLLGEEHTDTASSAANVGDQLLHLNEPARAWEYLEKAVRWHKASVGATHPRYAAALGLRGLAELALGRRKAALGSLEAALAVAVASKAPLREHVGETRFGLAKALWPGKRERALELARAAVADYTSAGPPHRERLDEIEAWLRERQG